MVFKKRAKLTEADVLNIFIDYSGGKLTNTALAKHYKVHQATISMILRRNYWTDVVIPEDVLVKCQKLKKNRRGRPAIRDLDTFKKQKIEFAYKWQRENSEYFLDYRHKYNEHQKDLKWGL